MISQQAVALRLILAALFGGLVGVEREVHKRPAGLRTHILVTTGSALIMLVSMYGFSGLGEGGYGGEPARLVAQVVSGIGFLGAGTILRDGNDVTGLTTAASIWVCGGIGIAIGGGYYLGALVTTAIVLFSLVPLSFFVKRISMANHQEISLVCEERAGLVGEIGILLGVYNISIKDIKILNSEKEPHLLIAINLLLKIPNTVKLEDIMASLRAINGVRTVVYK